MRGQASEGFRNRVHDTLFLQYTSGSTSDPKGVIVSQRNVVQNAHSTLTHVPVCVSWLPQYHDMGLIGYYLFPLIMGGTVYGFSPLNFLKRPALWLQTISRVQATITSSPNFGFDYCLREDKLPDEELEGVDLSSLRVHDERRRAGAGRDVRAVLRAIRAVRPDARRPRRRVRPGREHALRLELGPAGRHGQQAADPAAHAAPRELQPAEQQPGPAGELRQAAARRARCGSSIRRHASRSREREIGEIWVAGGEPLPGLLEPSRADREVFHGRIANGPADGPPTCAPATWASCHEGEVFVCGRSKDLIIIRGVNYYPQDIEAIVEASSPQIRKGGVAAFAVDIGGEALVVLPRCARRGELPDPAAIAKAIRTQYYIEPHTIAFVPHGTIVKTTSGKIARALTRQRWQDGELNVIASHDISPDHEPAERCPGCASGSSTSSSSTT